MGAMDIVYSSKIYILEYAHRLLLRFMRNYSNTYHKTIQPISYYIHTKKHLLTRPSSGNYLSKYALFVCSRAYTEINRTQSKPGRGPLLAYHIYTLTLFSNKLKTPPRSFSPQFRTNQMPKKPKRHLSDRRQRARFREYGRPGN